MTERAKELIQYAQAFKTFYRSCYERDRKENDMLWSMTTNLLETILDPEGYRVEEVEKLAAHFATQLTDYLGVRCR